MQSSGSPGCAQLKAPSLAILLLLHPLVAQLHSNKMQLLCQVVAQLGFLCIKGSNAAADDELKLPMQATHGWLAARMEWLHQALALPVVLVPVCSATAAFAQSSYCLLVLWSACMHPCYSFGAKQLADVG